MGFTTPSAAGVVKIKVVGNERLDAGTVQFYSKLPLTGDITQAQVDSAIKNLYSTSLFSKVSIRIVGSELIIRVKENPVVRSIRIRGNRTFSDKNLEEGVLQLKAMSIFTEAKLRHDLSTLHALYQSRGMLGAKISYSVSRTKHNAVDITLSVLEGRSTRVGEIRFVGNKVFSSTELKAVVASKEYSIKEFFGLFSGSTKFFSERLLVDQSLLRDFYASRGFFDFRVKSVVSEVSPDLSRATVVFSIEEGKKYRFGDSVITLSDAVQSYEGMEQDLLALVLSRKGEVFNTMLVNSSVARITGYLNGKGNLFASVKSDYEVQGDTVNVKYSVSPGSSVYIRRINLVGNTRTLDLVMRRKLGVAEGDVYSAVAIRQSRKRLMDMDFFESVDVETQKVSEDLVDLSFKVKERGTGSFDIGAGFSSASGLVGKISVKERNIFGTGKVVAFDLSRSMNSLSGMLDLVTPNLLDSDVAFGVGAFYSRQGGASSTKSLDKLLLPSEGPFSSTNAGVSARLSCGLTDTVAGSLQYSYKYHSIHNIGEAASLYIREQEGKHFDSAIGYSLAYSSLDSAYRPSSGVLAKISQSFSGVGGNLHYVKTEASSAHFFPILRGLNDSIVLKVKPAFGYVFAYAGEKVRIGQRFFIGSNEIRGFSTSGIGPRDRVTKEALGGKLFYGVSAQVDFPIGLPEHLGIRGSVFADVASLSRLDQEGQGYDTSDLPRLSIGFGFSWRSPFGPVRVDFGFPLVAEKFDIKDRMRISTDAGI
ncbi:MAG: outer membrane protein assembly factor BamA [Anaplasma sp.]